MKRIVSCLLLVLFCLSIPKAILAVDKVSLGAATLAFRMPQKAPLDTRAIKLESFLTSYKSPLAGSAEHLVEEADRNDLDWRLVAAIAGLESTFCKHIPQGSYNCWGWGIPTGAKSGVAFGSWEAGVTTVSEGLKTRYVDRGAITVEQIGRIYAASPTWASRIRFFLAKIDEHDPVTDEIIEVTL